MRRRGPLRLSFIMLVAVLSAFLWGGVALAGFSDLEGHWAADDIAKMNEAGLVGGYQDGTFLPKKTVNQVEALCMAVRVMGLKSSNVNALPQVPFPVPSWAEADVKVAVQNDLLKSSDQFSAYSGATRAWVARLLVRMIGKESEAEEGLLLPNFTDSYKIPEWAVYYVRVAQDNDLITGYNDKSFRPDNEVSRAEMVAFLSRVMKQLPERAVEDESDSSVNTYAFAEDQQTTSVLSGTVVKIYPESNAFVLKGPGGELKTLYLPAGTDESVDTLLPGDKVEVSLYSSGYVKRIDVNSRNAIAGSEGFVYDLDLDTGLLTIQANNKQLASYYLDDDVDVEVEGVRFSTMKDVRKGDWVKIFVDDDLVIGIDVLETASRLDVKGEVVLLDYDKDIINLDVDGKLQVYELSSNVQVNVSGLANAFLSDIDEGDTVTASVKDGKVTLLEVEGGQVEELFSAAVYAVDTENRVLTLKDNDDNLISYDVLKQARIIIDDDEESLSELERDMEVSVRLLDDEIIYVNTDNYLHGTVISFDEDGLYLKLRRDNGDHTSYILDDHVDVESKDNRNDLDDVNRGDYVRIVVEDDLVTEIGLSTLKTYLVERVRDAYDRLEVVDENGDSVRLSVEESVELFVPGVAYPDLDDVYEGDLVRATYMGNDLDKVEVLDPQYGQITSLNVYQNTITLRFFNGKTSTIIFTADSQVDIDGSVYNSISKLDSGDRVEVVENSDGSYMFKVMEKVSGKLAEAIDSNDDELYLDLGAKWKIHKLIEDVYMHNTSYRDVSGYAKGNQVNLYMLRDMVYEIVN